MSRDKAIYEIAKDLCASYGRCSGCGDEGKCSIGINAMVMYDSGYRKQPSATDILAEVEKLLHRHRDVIDGVTIYHAIPVNIEMKALRRKMEEQENDQN